MLVYTDSTMKIVHLTGEYPPYFLGGLGTYVHEITKQLAFLGCGVEVILLKDAEKVYNQLSIKARVTAPVTTKKFQVKSFDKISSTPLNTEDMVKSFRLKKIVNKHIDLLHIHDWYGVLFGACIKCSKKVPVVITSHLPIRAGFTYTGHDIPLKQKMQLESLGFRIADLVLAPSQFVADVLMSEYNVDKKKLRVISNGVDLETFKPLLAKKLFDQQKVKLLSVSRLTEQKGIVYLLDVLKKLSESTTLFTCTIVGEGPLKRQLEIECARLSLSDVVTFTGFLEKEAVKSLYREHDMFISTSIYEPFGLVILEAMASGLPPVAFNIGGIREIVDSEVDGILVEPCNTEEMAALIKDYTKSKKKLALLSENAQTKALKYDWKSIAYQVYTTYEELISR